MMRKLAIMLIVVLDRLPLVISFNLAGLCLFGCALPVASLPSPKKRTQQAAQLALRANWQSFSIPTHAFLLQAYGSRALSHTNILRIYIEGDGLAWITATQPSNNPTPIVPTGLQMALHDQHYPVVYLARPCQYVTKIDSCRYPCWTNLRFAPEVVNDMNQAVDVLKQKYHAKKIILIGYSGGGTIAALLAARRHDVIKLVTVAAVLDIKKWTKQHNLTPLYGSLNPADEWQKLINLPQTHWIGSKDKVVTEQNIKAYAAKYATGQQPKIIIMPQFDHACCWTKLQLVV